MKRLLLLFCIMLFVIAAKANKNEVIYQGPKQIGDWGTVELSSVKFHDLEMGDTIYVYASKVGENSKGAFQDHEWHAYHEDMYCKKMSPKNPQFVNRINYIIDNDVSRLIRIVGRGTVRTVQCIPFDSSKL